MKHILPATVVKRERELFVNCSDGLLTTGCENAQALHWAVLLNIYTADWLSGPKTTTQILTHMSKT